MCFGGRIYILWGGFGGFNPVERRYLDPYRG